MRISACAASASARRWRAPPGPASSTRPRTSPNTGASTVSPRARLSLLGVEPLPLQVDYHDIVARMEVWLFEQGEALQGVLALEAEPDALLIWSVATAPDAQGVGLGNLMLDFAHARAREMNLATIRLYT